MENIEKKVLEHDICLKSMDIKIAKLEAQGEQIHDLVTSVKLLAQSMDKMCAEQTKMSTRLETIEKEPADKYRNIKNVILAAVVTAVVTALVTLVVSKLGG